ncbi:MAG: molybdopterin dinucleotide binding domain-containing protein, partial [Chloroflexota bacterium]
YASASDVFAELAAQVPAFNGMSYAKLKGQLTRSRAHFLYEGTSYETVGGQGMVMPSAAENSESKFELTFVAPAMPADVGSAITAPLQLVAPRVLYDAGTLIAETELLRAVTPASYADLNRADAERLGVNDGDTIRLTTANGAVAVTARVDGRAPVGVVVAPMNLAPADTRGLVQRGEVAIAVTIEKA